MVETQYAKSGDVNVAFQVAGEALSANVAETPTPHSITVGRWKVKTDDSREEVDDVERAPRAWG